MHAKLVMEEHVPRPKTIRALYFNKILKQTRYKLSLNNKENTKYSSWRNANLQKIKMRVLDLIEIMIDLLMKNTKFYFFSFLFIKHLDH